jgi:hypothetical protein
MSHDEQERASFTAHQSLEPVSSFADALSALNSLKSEDVVEDYAIVGAMELLFWTEPVPTLGLDVLVLLPPTETKIVSLDGIYRWAETRKYPSADEHIIVEGVPTQFVPSPNALADEAVATAAVVDYSSACPRRPSRVPGGPLPGAWCQDCETQGTCGWPDGAALVESRTGR